MGPVYAECFIISTKANDARPDGWPSERVAVTDAAYIDEHTDIVACDCVNLRKEIALRLYMEGGTSVVECEGGQLFLASPSTAQGTEMEHDRK